MTNSIHPLAQSRDASTVKGMNEELQLKKYYIALAEKLGAWNDVFGGRLNKSALERVIGLNRGGFERALAAEFTTREDSARVEAFLDQEVETMLAAAKMLKKIKLPAATSHSGNVPESLRVVSGVATAIAASPVSGTASAVSG